MGDSNFFLTFEVEAGGNRRLVWKMKMAAGGFRLKEPREPASKAQQAPSQLSLTPVSYLATCLHGTLWLSQGVYLPERIKKAQRPGPLHECSLKDFHLFVCLFFVVLQSQIAYSCQ